ncbi:oxidoreductase of aldo/keto reductase family subgroup 1 [Patulibacter medicamentivorans]|uniref:Oxidoreductase of aldo/keto reductase family subgroup 1 n=2 Tax=Patulibacter medicamentivorans TaxID=1097667 RepID=H0EAG8_9ACTN|nr:oxidoreductase of aldo/keto reductase family subgroup 1 [Patulibacter medicamentivorans]
MDSMTQIPTIPLNSGTSIPQVGFGVFQVPAEETEAAVLTALEAGYRSIDTAAAYRNETAVGAAIKASGIPREELFVTTKLWNADQGAEEALRAFDVSLGKLGLTYVDLYLIHWPAPGKQLYVETWQALEKVQAEGSSRAIGVSNFQTHHLREILESSDVVPAVNQIELHPRLAQAELRAFHAEHGIVTEAWSPLAQGAVLNDPTITSIARAHGRTPAQVVLRWHVQLGNVVIPKSVTPERIAANVALFDFELSDEQMAAIAKLDDGTRTGPHPDEFGA